MSYPKTIHSYYHYPIRSFLRNKRAYILLACSILCMIVLCASVLIYYASRYEASIEMMRREDGPHHTVLMGVKGDLRSEYTNHSYVKDFAAVDICAKAQNPNVLASLETVSFTAYDEQIASFFYLKLTQGRLPEAFGEVIVSEYAARYFEGLQMGGEQKVEVQSNGHQQEVPFRVVGTFTSADPAFSYVFCTPETAGYLRGGNAPGSKFTSDVYLIFEGKGQSAIKRNMDAFIADIGMVKYDSEGNEVEINFEDRNKMLTEIAQIAPYYEGSTMLVMFLFSLLPAGIALVVFIYLDLQKNLKELATLSMIGATWKQIFRMQLVKYAAIFFAVFPFGIAGAAALMRLVCALTKNISEDHVYLWFHFDIGAMFVLLLLSTAILLGVVFILSKRMTSVAYAQMLSAAHKSGNIFVAKTSDILFRGKRILERIAVLFFTRNRGINRLFCVVIVLLVCVYAFFSQQISVEYNEAPSAAEMELADFYLYGDIDLSSVYETMIPETADAIAAIPHVERIQRRMEVSSFYTYLNTFLVESNIQKQLVSNTVKSGQFGQSGGSMPVYKRNITDVRLIGADEALLDMRVGADVVSGSLESIYANEDTIALVVHGWSDNNDKFYHAGDTLKLRVSYTEEDENRPGKVNKVRTEWKDYTIGAVIYRPNDDPYDDIITVYTSPALFTQMTRVDEVYCYAVRCDSRDADVLAQVREELHKLELDYRFVIQDVHEQLSQAKLASMHAVLFIAVMQGFVLIVAVLLLIAMAHFMLEVRAPSMRALYLIGAQHTQLARINILEFVIASVISSAAGILCSGLIGLFHIGNLTPALILISAFTLLLLTAINILVPIWICRRKLRTQLLS